MSTVPDPPVDPRGQRFAPYGALFRTVLAPRLAAPTEREAAAPVRFAQAVGFVFAAVATVGFAAGWARSVWPRRRSPWPRPR